MSKPQQQPSSVVHHKDLKIPLKTLLPSQIAMIDEALASLGDFGEVRLVVEKKRLRFIVTQKSFDTLKWQPGSIAKASR